MWQQLPKTVKKSNPVGVYVYASSRRCHCLSLRWFHGQIFPFAFKVAAPSAACAVFVKLLEQQAVFDMIFKTTHLNGSVFSAFSTLVSFVVVFRTSQAHARFSDGVSFMYQMLGDWTDAASSLIAFSSHAKREDGLLFRHSIVRMISLLNALMLAELAIDDEHLVERRAFQLEILDVEGFSKASLNTLRNTPQKTEVVFHWLQCYIVQSIPTGLAGIPAPILSRAFQMLGNGVQHFHQCKQLSQVPWPFPYTQTTDALLMIHWIVTPVCMGAWANSMLWACVFTFIQVFVCWALNTIAIELENPFDEGQDDMDLAEIQRHLNQTLLTLVHPASNSPPEATICNAFFGESLTDRSTACSRVSLMKILADDDFEPGAAQGGSPGQQRGGLNKTASLDSMDEMVDLPQEIAIETSKKSPLREISTVSTASAVAADMPQIPQLPLPLRDEPSGPFRDASNVRWPTDISPPETAVAAVAASAGMAMQGASFGPRLGPNELLGFPHSPPSSHGGTSPRSQGLETQDVATLPEWGHSSLGSSVAV